VSDLYRTAPIGPPQPDFLNAVAAIDVRLGSDPATTALALLDRCKAIEHDLGRRRRARWGPREIDLDLLVFGRHRIDLPMASDRSERWLVVPHPEARRRLFVLAPLADLTPGLVPPGWGETVASARRRLAAEQGEGVVRVGRWTPSGWVIADPGAPSPVG